MFFGLRIGLSRHEVMYTPVGEMLDYLACRAIAAGEAEQVVYCEVDDLAQIR